MARFVLRCRHRLNQIIRPTYYKRKKQKEQLVIEVQQEDDCLFSLVDISPFDGIDNTVREMLYHTR